MQHGKPEEQKEGGPKTANELLKLIFVNGLVKVGVKQDDRDERYEDEKSLESDFKIARKALGSREGSCKYEYCYIHPGNKENSVVIVRYKNGFATKWGQTSQWTDMSMRSFVMNCSAFQSSDKLTLCQVEPKDTLCNTLMNFLVKLQKKRAGETKEPPRKKLKGNFKRDYNLNTPSEWAAKCTVLNELRFKDMVLEVPEKVQEIIMEFLPECYVTKILVHDAEDTVVNDAIKTVFSWLNSVL